MTPTEPRIFISYSATEATLAQAMCAFLEMNGLSCWIAPRDMEVGNSFSQTIIEKIENSYALVLILSHTSNESDYVFSEIANAFQRKIPVLEFRVHPIALHKRLELYLRMQHYLDATTGRPEDLFPTLCNHCAAKKAGPAPQHLYLTVTQPGQPGGVRLPHSLDERPPLTRTEPTQTAGVISRQAVMRTILFVAAGLLLAIMLYLLMFKRGGGKEIGPLPPIDTSSTRTDSIRPGPGNKKPSTITQVADSLTRPNHSDSKRHTAGTAVTPMSKIMQALDGATFIDGPSLSLAKSDDKISFAGLQGNSIQFNLHVSIYDISGKMRITGNTLVIVQADPSCTGNMIVGNDGAKLTGSFKVSSSDSPTPVELSRQKQ